MEDYLVRSKYGLVLGISLLILTGCGETVDNITEKANTVIEKKNEVVDKVKEINSDVNEVTTTFDKKVQAVKSTVVFDNDYTFEELFDTTLTKTTWKSDKDNNQVIVSGYPNKKLFDKIVKELDKQDEKAQLAEKTILDESTKYTIIFPLFGETDIPTANTVFTSFEAYITIDGAEQPVNGDSLIGLLNDIYKVNQKVSEM